MTLKEIKQYLRIDYDDDDLLLNSLIETTENYIDNCVGVTYKKYDNKSNLADLLTKKMIGDMHDNRGLYLDSKKKGYDRMSNTILDILSNCEE